MTDPSSTLARIDAEVEAWERGDDAAHWRADVALTPETRPVPASRIEYGRPRMWASDAEVDVTSITLQQHRRSLGTFSVAAEFERQMAILSQEERDEFVAYWQAGPWSLEQAWGNWCLRRTMEPLRVTMVAWAEQLTAALRGAQESVTQFSRILRLEPWPHGWDGSCFCHPAPFPAARDYRRRTKHRNRRRR